MSPDEQPLSGLSALEAALASLAPRAEGLDRERLMFLAGQASVARPPVAHVRMWQAGFAAMSAVAASLLMALVTQPAPQVVERSVPAALPSTPTIPAHEQGEPSERADGWMSTQAGTDGKTPGARLPWPFQSLAGRRLEGPLDQLAAAVRFPAALAWPREVNPDCGPSSTEAPTGAGVAIPAMAFPSMSYRELLDHALRENGVERAGRSS